MKLLIFIALGGALGSILRYLSMTLAGHILGVAFPYGTLFVNIVGSFVMGVVIGVGAHHLPISQEARAFLAVGVLGGFTTFSAFSLDVVTLYENGQVGIAAFYALASVILSVLALFAGLLVMRAAG